MNSYRFTIKTTEDTILKEVIFIEEDSAYRFSVNADDYMIEYSSEHLSFIKETADNTFSLKLNKGALQALIKLKNEDLSMDIPVEEFSYKPTENGFTLEYKLCSQESPLTIIFEKHKNNS